MKHRVMCVFSHLSFFLFFLLSLSWLRSRLRWRLLWEWWDSDDADRLSSGRRLTHKQYQSLAYKASSLKDFLTFEMILIFLNNNVTGSWSSGSQRSQSLLYLWEESSDRVDSSSSSSSSSLHCLASSSEWTLITSLITCSVFTVMTDN